MPEDPFLARLQAHANALRLRPPEEIDEPPPTAGQSSAAGAQTSPRAERSMLGFWQHPVARSYIQRRITGSATRTPVDVIAEAATGLQAGLGVSLRMTDPAFEVSLVQRGLSREIVAIDEDPARVQATLARIPPAARDYLTCRHGEIASIESGEPPSLVIARSVLHRHPDPETMVRAIYERMAPGGLLHVDEFIGPARHQWTDQQIAIVTRLLQVLPRELREDLTASDGRKKDNIGRADPAAFAAAHPEEAAGSDRIVEALDRHFERVVFRPYGGAVFHQLFSRIMGNFASRGDLVSLVMETDGILTDYGVLDSDYLWAVYRRP
jgi:SAM-dependent methyltransferase